MDLNAWSLALSILGAALGIISAWATLKRFSASTIKAAGQAAIRSADRDNALADMFLQQPAALVAYITYRVLGGLILLGLGIEFLGGSGSFPINLPELANNISGLLLSGILANLVSSPILISWKVYRRAVRTMRG